jgi:hypothetical protein
MVRALIGTSGWNYPGSREHLSDGTPAKRWLAVAVRTLDTLEIIGSSTGRSSARRTSGGGARASVHHALEAARAMRRLDRAVARGGTRPR